MPKRDGPGPQLLQLFVAIAQKLPSCCQALLELAHGIGRLAKHLENLTTGMHAKTKHNRLRISYRTVHYGRGWVNSETTNALKLQD